MKKILFLLLCTVSIYGQVSTGQEQEFDYGIKNNASQTVTIPTNIVTQGADGTQGIISPNYLIDVIEVSSATTLPVTGVVAKIYCTLDNNKIYRWNGTIYQELAVTDISSKENTTNKQNSLAIDGTGGKYVTVDAVNTIDLQKVIDVNGYAEVDGGNSNVNIFQGTTNDRSIEMYTTDGVNLAGGIQISNISTNIVGNNLDTQGVFGVDNGIVRIEQNLGVGKQTIVNFKNPSNLSTINFPAPIVSGTYTLATLDDIQAPALLSLNEGNGIGYRIATYPATNYGNIGLNAIDFSVSDTISSSFGATGTGSFASGYKVTARGWQSAAFGNRIDNGGSSSFDAGINLKDAGYANSLFGIGHDVTSMNTTVVGQAANVISRSILYFNTDTTKPLFVVGNGTIAQNDINYSVLTRSDALIARLNGSVEAPSLTTTLIDADATGKILLTKEYANSHYGSGSGTVTSISGTNGVTVATGSTTPVIGLGAITPTSTNGVSAATMAYMDATASVQTQLNGKQATLTNPVTGTGTSGQVSFWNGTNTQTGDNGLFWNNTNKTLGIGTTVPSSNSKLHILGGVTIQTPNSNGIANSADASQALIFNRNGNTVNNYYMGYTFGGSLSIGYTSNSFSATSSIFNLSNTGNLTLPAGTLTISGAGNSSIAGPVGIGTTVPAAKLVINSGELLVNTNVNNGIDKLQVNGSIIANDIKSTGIIRLKGYTVATLPAGVQGDNAFVTDALAPSFMVTIVGGGTVVTKVFYNGTNWIAD